MKITIVIPSFNQRGFIGATLDSVLSQQGDFDLAVDVVDGGSTDGTVDLLRDVTDPRVNWTSEPDNGQSDAINKGLRRATGDVVSWLNSDDVYTPGTLAAVAEAFRTQSDKRWLVGRCENIDVQGRVVRSWITRYKDFHLRRYSYRKLLTENFISQMSVFWRRSFQDEVGLLDEGLHYTMDYDLWLRMGEHSDPIVLDRVLGQFRLHPQSKSGAVNRRQFDEQYEVACRRLGGRPLLRAAHRLHVEKTVWAYRLLRRLGA